MDPDPDEPALTASNDISYPRVSTGTVIVVVLITLVVALSVAVALGTALVAIAQLAAGWLKFSPLHVLICSATVLFSAVFVFSVIAIIGCLHEIRDALNGATDYPHGWLNRLVLEDLIEATSRAALQRPRSRPRRKPKATPTPTE